ncbi:MAG TPA: prephenate dehydrogenase dimerization domain-containing protein, partial [Vicinamibacterales bacterium]|nr:prephenate dehydrogenase dimerization domain-containing protein [Vicinamibacterales bacterium]
HARADLFAGRPWILTPEGDQETGSVTERLSAFVQGLGARALTMASGAAHDEVLAFIGHLPQLTASALMAVVGDAAGEWLHLAGRGLADATRLAAAPAGAWRDVCATSVEPIGLALDRLIALLQSVRAGLGSDETVDRLFASANDWRARLPPDA